MHYLLAIDQGTTNSRAIIFDRQANIMGQHECALTQYYPQAGWVEQDPEEMFNHTVDCCRQALINAKLTAKEIAAIGISNQRETTIIWDKKTGKPVYPAIVWQDRRTSDYCAVLSQQALGTVISHKTGLLLDPYFSATKIVWILNHVPGVRERAERDELLFGTVDTYLLWKLTGGRVHVTDVTNASRTLLFNIHTQEWDKDILNVFHVPANLLPRVLDNTADFGELDESILGQRIPITGVAGDQQAATIGQACFSPGMVKATYGTGAFMLLNTGTMVIQSQNQLLSTIAYRINKQITYGLEGSIFCAGVTIKWLRDTLKLIQTADETAHLANLITSTEGVYLVPAFTGLGAPYWDPHARGALLGLTRNSGREHIVRAALESVAYQTRDLLEAMTADSKTMLKTLRVDGGMAANDWLLAFLSDILNLEVQRPTCIETSALGAAYLAGLQIGMYQSLEEIALLWNKEKSFTPQMSIEQRDQFYQGWKRAIDCVKYNKK
ncbi:MAG: glycerol kinase GlpK [Gammaproteobacteria bacterium]|nr:glycerol kinase GlpK [Gammaproteobacteria bacterium]